MKYRRIVSAIALVAAMAVSLVPGLARAQQPGGSGLQISPTRTELSVNDGEVKDFAVSVKNVTQGDITVTVFLNDFTAGEQGEPKLIVDKREREPSSLQEYLKGLQDFDLKSGETKEVKYSIDFPPNTAAGAYYGAVRFVAIPKGSDRNAAERQVALNASVASLILVQLEGDIIESVQIEKIEVRIGDKPSTFFTKRPNKLAVSIKNKGNGFAKPFGNVQILGMNGSQVYSYEFNNKDPRGNVLPGSGRVFVDDIQGIKMPGRYTAVVNISYGGGGEVLTQRVSFWYMPLWVIGPFIALLLIIGFLVYRFVIRNGRLKRIRKY